VIALIKKQCHQTVRTGHPEC